MKIVLGPVGEVAESAEAPVVFRTDRGDLAQRFCWPDTDSGGKAQALLQVLLNLPPDLAGFVRR